MQTTPLRSHAPVADGYLTTRDRLKLYYRERLVPEPRGHVILVHGVSEHYGRYRHVEDFLAGAGYSFHFHDLRGHGQSEGRRVFVDRFERYLEDLDLLVAHVERSARGPIFLVGHSLGGLIAVRYLETRQARFAGCVLSGAALMATLKPPLPVFLALRAISRFRPEMPVPGLVPARFISRDTDVVVRYMADPLVPKWLTTGFGMASLDAMEQSLADAQRIDLPMLILHGGDDRLVTKRASEELYRRARSTDKTLRIYPGLYHELFNEPERHTILDEVLGWLEARRAAPANPRA